MGNTINLYTITEYLIKHLEVGDPFPEQNYNQSIFLLDRNPYPKLWISERGPFLAMPAKPSPSLLHSQIYMH